MRNHISHKLKLPPELSQRGVGQPEDTDDQVRLEYGDSNCNDVHSYRRDAEDEEITNLAVDGAEMEPATTGYQRDDDDERLSLAAVKALVEKVEVLLSLRSQDDCPGFDALVCELKPLTAAFLGSGTSHIFEGHHLIDDTLQELKLRLWRYLESLVLAERPKSRYWRFVRSAKNQALRAFLRGSENRVEEIQEDFEAELQPTLSSQIADSASAPDELFEYDRRLSAASTHAQELLIDFVAQLIDLNAIHKRNVPARLCRIGFLTTYLALIVDRADAIPHDGTICTTLIEALFQHQAQPRPTGSCKTLHQSFVSRELRAKLPLLAPDLRDELVTMVGVDFIDNLVQRLMDALKPYNQWPEAVSEALKQLR